MVDKVLEKGTLVCLDDRSTVIRGYTEANGNLWVTEESTRQPHVLTWIKSIATGKSFLMNKRWIIPVEEQTDD